MDFFEIKDKVIEEIKDTLSKVGKKKVETLIKMLLSAEKVFVAGTGRSMLMMKSFAKRLKHLNLNVYVVGETIEPPATERDLLILASGSGESILPLRIAKIARRIGTRVVLITAKKNSKIMKLADFVLYIPAPTKFSKKKSFQPLGNLFEQSLLLFCDVVAILVQKKKKLSNNNLLKHHANLE